MGREKCHGESGTRITQKGKQDDEMANNSDDGASTARSGTDVAPTGRRRGTEGNGDMWTGCGGLATLGKETRDIR